MHHTKELKRTNNPFPADDRELVSFTLGVCKMMGFMPTSIIDARGKVSFANMILGTAGLYYYKSKVI